MAWSTPPKGRAIPRFFPQIHGLAYTTGPLTTVADAPCLAFSLAAEGLTPTQLSHRITAFQGFLLLRAMTLGREELWRAALDLQGECPTGGAPQFFLHDYLPPAPQWGQEMGALQRYAIAATAGDAHLRYATLWQAFALICPEERLSQQLQEFLSVEDVNHFTDYVRYITTDEQWREESGFAKIFPPTHVDSPLFCAWAQLFQRENR